MSQIETLYNFDEFCFDRRAYSVVKFFHGYSHLANLTTLIDALGDAEEPENRKIWTAAVSVRPFFEHTFADLVVFLGKLLSMHDHVSVFLDREKADTHILSVASLHQKSVQVRYHAKGKRICLKDLVFALMRDWKSLALANGITEVFSICGSPLCFAPDHLVLADASERRARMICQDQSSPCIHHPPCLVGDKAVPAGDAVAAGEGLSGREADEAGPSKRKRTVEKDTLVQCIKTTKVAVAKAFANTLQFLQENPEENPKI